MAHTFQAAAASLLADHGPLLPDLSGITVLVPHHHVRAPFIAALQAQLAGAGVFLPPRFLTLPEAAASQAGVPDEPPDSVRLLRLYGLLSRLGWLDEAALWPQAQAMDSLLCEMDDTLLVPPPDYAGFAGQIEQATRRPLAAAMDREARLVFEVWRAHQVLGAGAGYAGRLARWLEQARGPLYSVGLHGLSGVEQHFLARCREAFGLVELPLEAPHAERHAVLRAAWQPGEDALSERAAALAASIPASPLAADLAILAASDMEMEAQSVAAQIRRWLAEGRRTIGVIALDRFAARRLRAVLERDAILMQDETGWTFSTTSVSHVLDRWFQLLQDDFYHRDLLDLLKSPFVFGDIDPQLRLESVANLERAIARRDAINGLDRFVALAADDVTAVQMLTRLKRASDRFRAARRQPVANWLEVLFDALGDLEALEPIRSDQAGRQLLDLLHRLKVELAAERTPFGLARWRGWLNIQLDRATFQETVVESPIRLTHLAAARLRAFDAVVVLGADAAHLPPAVEPGVFGEAVRIQLGLPGRSERVAEIRDALIDVLSRAGRVLLSWQARRGLETNPVSPWLRLLEALHRLAYGTNLRLTEPPLLARAAMAALPAPEPARLTRLPPRLSASAWQKLVSCPYRFFAHYDLGLGEQEAVAEDMEKADYGELVHLALSRFHVRHPVLAELSPETLEADLTALSEEVFRPREDAYYLAQAWRRRWARHIPAYIDWALDHEAAGWHWQETEREFTRLLALPGGEQVTLYGRLDRLDESAAGQAVIDYKTQGVQRLKSRLKMPGEDVQLPFYGLLTGATKAGLVALDDAKVELVELNRPLADAANAEASRIGRTFGAMLAGAPLPANGAPDSCAWCEMRGICRKDVGWAGSD